jgi:hypothetical protein
MAMDGSGAIERNRLALTRIVASLVAMAGLAIDPDIAAEGRPRNTLPRHLWIAILRLLRPAEAAARRLIIAAARGIVVPPPTPRKPTPKPADPAPMLRSLGIAVTVSSANMARAQILPRVQARRLGRGRPQRGSSPVYGGAAGDGGGSPSAPRIPAFPLLDPLRNPLRPSGHTRHARAVPRILFPGITEPFRIPPPPSPDDPVSAAGVARRLAALAAALEDLPRQARRFARWKARLDAGLVRRISPLRGGPPPGGRLRRYDPDAPRRRNTREIDEILVHAHDLALYALERPDTS